MRLIKSFGLFGMAFLLITSSVAANAEVGTTWATIDNTVSMNEKALPLKIQVNEKNVDNIESEQQVVFDLDALQPEMYTGTSKILDALDSQMKEEQVYFAPNTLKVSVMINYDAGISKEQFLEQYAQVFENTVVDHNGFGIYSFFAELTPEQIEEVASFAEVSSISTTDDVVAVYGEFVEGQEGTYLNAATEMTGIKKARSDYGVTGNRDGSASYSKNDSVIAVIDTGIDGGHVDLSGGKIIGWKDFVNGQANPYDDLGHGTHVASIAAGTGAGDPNIQAGVAPGAALVGLKVCLSNTNCSTQNILDAMDWIINNKDTYGIDVINISLGSSGSPDASFCSKVASAANKGILTVVAAGNTSTGANYFSLNRLGKCSNVISVGNMADPYEGGWYLNHTSNRGNGSQGPSMTAPGTLIRAAKANSINEYVSATGTSMASPMIAGLAALMLHASNGSVSYNFITEDFGMNGYDKVYGNGLILGHNTIKAAKGSSSGSFNNFRDHIRAQSSINANTIDFYDIKVNSTSAFFANTLIINDENGAKLELYVWGPGVEPIQNGQLRLDLALRSSTVNLPQQTISFKPTSTGKYKIGILARNNATYAIDWSGQISL